MRNIKFYLFIAVFILIQSGAAFSEDVLPSFRENIFKSEEFKALPKATGTAEVRPTITAIELQGNFTITEDKIREAIFSRIGDTLYEEKIKLDLKAIYAIGYFSDVNVHFYNYKDGSKVVFEVIENPTISEIRFEGNTVYPADMLKRKMKTKEFEMLNYQTLRDDIDTINKLYKDDGYMVARVIDVSTDEWSGVLTIKMVEGVIEKIEIEGNETTHDYVILREFNTKPGGILNEKVLSKDLRKVFNLGFFQEISPSFQPGSSPDKIVIIINVKESRTSSINFGGGFGEKEGWFGFIDLSINNLFGTGRGLLIRGQTGQEVQTYQFKYSEPWVFPSLFGDHATMTFRKWYTIGKDIYLTEENEVRNGFDVSLGKPYGEDFNASVSLGSEQVSPYQDATFEAYRSDTVGFTFSYDTRDFWLNPQEGSFHSFQTRWGWKQTSISTSFQKY
ncbi:MAG: BamA/TamA family outer membrane protein, partial [Candidatus Saganbacteria bacterium]|nr:BamA/TamA family outer membrane protein [Candidatus Saganbacteria bacterium]